MEFKLNDIAGMIDHSLLHPTMTDQDLINGCNLAANLEVAAVCIKPYFVKQCAEILKDTKTQVCTVVGFPSGSSTIAAKVFETKQAIKDGATEIDMVVNIGKVLAEDWRYIKKEMNAINKACLAKNAILKVIFENDFLPKDRHKVKLCQIANVVGVAFVKTSTGFGYVKQPNGDFNYVGATEKDLILMRKHCKPEIAIKAAGGVRTLDGLLKVRQLGCTRLGTSATEGIIAEAKKRLGLATETIKDTGSGY